MTTACSCLLSMLLVVAGQAPSQPDFSGRWVLVSPDTAPADIPGVLVVTQHLQQTDARGNPMTPYWDRLIVRRDDSRGGIRLGSYRIGVMGGGVYPLVGGDPSVLLPQRMTRGSVTWQGDTLVIVSEAWIEREHGKRESYEQHREVWAMPEQGRLVITVTDSNGESRNTRTVTYGKEQR